MPRNIEAFHSDVKKGNGGVRLEFRLVVWIPWIPFWWLGERDVLMRWPDPDGPETLMRADDQWHVDEFDVARSGELMLKYPALQVWGDFGKFTFSPDQARAIGEALAEISQDKDVPGAEGLAMASRFLAMAAAHDCFVEMSGR